MSRRYTQDEKAAYLAHLDDNYGNVTLTAIQTGIPSRTLYNWKRERKLRRLQSEPPLLHKKSAVPPPQTATNPDDTEAEYTRIRAEMMTHIDNLMSSLTDDPDTAHLRIIALTRLLDRVIKLEALTKRENIGEKVIRVEYQYPDGSIHDVPPWARSDPEPYTPPKITPESIGQEAYDELMSTKK